MDCKDFCCEGNIFADLKLLPLKDNITPSQHSVSGHQYCVFFLKLYEPLCLSLPMNDDVKTLLASLSTWLTNGYLVTRVIQCPTDPCWPGSSTSTTPFCTFVKPFIWRQNAGTDSVLEEQSGGEIMGDQVRFNDVGCEVRLVIGSPRTSLFVCLSITMFFHPYISTGIYKLK